MPDITHVPNPSEFSTVQTCWWKMFRETGDCACSRAALLLALRQLSLHTAESESESESEILMSVTQTS